MSQARLLFSEAWASIRMNLSTTFAATMTVLIGMCLLGLFIALGTWVLSWSCLLYTSPSPRDLSTSRMPSSA